MEADSVSDSLCLSLRVRAAKNGGASIRDFRLRTRTTAQLYGNRSLATRAGGGSWSSAPEEAGTSEKFLLRELSGLSSTKAGTATSVRENPPEGAREVGDKVGLGCA